MALPMLAMETEMKLQLTTSRGSGLTLTELLVVICVLAVVVVVLLPGLVPQRRALSLRSRIDCFSNLKQIAMSFRVWEGDNSDRYPMQVTVTNGGAMELAMAGNVSAIFRVMSNEIVSPKVLVCPEDTGRHFATNFTTDLNHQTISYFVSLDAENRYPKMILSGDDNLEINGGRVRPGILNLRTNASVGWTTERMGRFHGPGNIALVDGSVQTSAIQSAPMNTGSVTNRLVIP